MPASERLADTPAIRLLRVGPSAIIADAGRPGWAHLAIAESGAFDRQAYAAANRLVGNNDGATAIEFVLGGLSFVAMRALTFAVTGVHARISLTSATTETADHAGAARPHHRLAADHTTITVPANTRVDVGIAHAGLRGYLAFRGGLALRKTLGSASTDTMSGLGPEPLTDGTVLAVGTESPAANPDWQPQDWWPFAIEPPAGATTPPVTLAVLPPPRTGPADPLHRALITQTWQVTTDSDRIGVRLSGGTMPTQSAHSPSEGVVRGTVQLPPNGDPIVLGPDHPTTGGYPVVGVVRDRDTDLLAQARPGTRLQFRPA